MDETNNSPWQDTVSLLRLVKNDYESVRKQLEIACESLSEREYAADQRLTQAILLCGGYRTLCLAPVDSDSNPIQIGNVILGEAIPYDMISSPLKLNVYCFERLEIFSGNRKLNDWQNTNAKSLFRLFLTRPRESIVKDVIMGNLWPECNTQAAGNNLKVAVHGLRKILNHFLGQDGKFPSIVFNSGSYELNPQIELWIDIEQFEYHWQLGRRLEKEGEFTAAIKEFEAAEELYKGDYMEDEPYDDRFLIRRETLKDIYLIILGKIADYLLQIEDYEGSIIYSQKIIAKDNCREDAYRRMMLCYSRQGNRNRAMRWYEICCHAMRVELDTTPEPETTLLYQQLFDDVYI